MIRTLQNPKPADVAPRVEDFLRQLGGPTWIEVAGRDRSRCRVVTTLVHGNEPSGVRALHGWLREGQAPAVDVQCFVAAVETALAPPGFAHRMLPGRADLNRSFLPPFEGPEGSLARATLERCTAAAPEALVDLHNNTGHSPAYGVGGAADAHLLALTAHFADRFVVSTMRLGALVEATHASIPSVVIECGRAGDPTADAVARRGLQRFVAADTPFEAPPSPLDVLSEPVRVEIRSGLEVAFGDAPVPGAGFTVAADLDRHNFEEVPVGSTLGWVAEGVWPVSAVDEDGTDRSPELFVAEAGELRARRPIVPIMMTTDARAALSDCLFYAVRRHKT